MTVIDDDLKQQAKTLWLEGKKYKEISEITGIKESTIKSFVNRVWKKEKLQPMKRKVAVAKKVATKLDAPPIKEMTTAEIEILANEELTDKQRLFCLYYSRTFNATSSYQKAFDSKYSTAMCEGSKLLGKPMIKEEIMKLKQARVQKEMLSQEDIFQKYMEIAFADITDFVEFGVQPLNVDGVQIEEVQVNYVALKDSKEVDGTLINEVKKGKDGVSVKLPDRMKALEWLDKHMGLANEEQKERIALLKAQRSKLGQRDDADDDGVEIINDV